MLCFALFVCLFVFHFHLFVLFVLVVSAASFSLDHLRRQYYSVGIDSFVIIYIIVAALLLLFLERSQKHKHTAQSNPCRQYKQTMFVKRL